MLFFRKAPSGDPISIIQLLSIAPSRKLLSSPNDSCTEVGIGQNLLRQVFHIEAFRENDVVAGQTRTRQNTIFDNMKLRSDVRTRTLPALHQNIPSGGGELSFQRASV